MQNVTERTILLIVVIFTCIAALFWIIGISAPGWANNNLFQYANTSTKALCIIALILLILSIVLAAILVLGTLQNPNLPLIFIISLIIASIFILATFGSLFSGSQSYSWDLMIVSLSFTYLASMLAMFWLGTTQKLTGFKVTSSSSVTVTY